MKDVLIVALIIALIVSTIIVFYFRFSTCDRAKASLRDKQDLSKLVPYDVSMCKAAMSSCLDSETSPNCQLKRSNSIQPFFGYKINLLKTDPSVSGMNCCFEYHNKQVCSTDGKVNNWNDQGRPVLVYYPNSVLLGKQEIPYVIYFSFIPWNAKTDVGYGLFNPDRVDACTLGTSCGTAPMSPLWMQLQLQSFLAAGYAVVLTTMIAEDSYIYQETCPSPLEKENNFYNLCWNKGHNADASYLQKLFTSIKNKELFTKNHVELLPADPTLGTLHDGVKTFNHQVNLGQECGLIGYSVGAQMVSRAINEFGNSSSVIKDAPDVVSACMVSGGSLHCYEYCNGDDMTPRGYEEKICAAQPQNWGPCWNEKSLGCCPAGLTEPRYDQQTTEEHPPVILVQTDFDYYADPRASENYYNALKKKNVDTQIVNGLCGNHNLFPSAILPVLSFFKQHMPPTAYSSI